MIVDLEEVQPNMPIQLQGFNQVVKLKVEEKKAGEDDVVLDHIASLIERVRSFNFSQDLPSTKAEAVDILKQAKKLKPKDELLRIEVSKLKQDVRKVVEVVS